MPTATCPYCSSRLDSPFILAGNPIRCDECGQRFVPQGVLSEVQYDQPAIPSQPSIVVVGYQSPHRPQARLRAQDWFTRSFMTVSGCLMAFLAFNVLAMIVILFFFALLKTAVDIAPKNQPPHSVSPR